jgi:hypothetical protein
LDAWDIEAVEHIGHRVGAEGSLSVAWLEAEESLELWDLELVLESVEAGDAQHRCVREGVDHLEGRDVRPTTTITERLELLRDAVGPDGVFLELVEASSLGRAFFEELQKAHLSRGQLRAFVTCLRIDRSVELLIVFSGSARGNTTNLD